MDWIVGGFLLVGFLVFWAVWIFGYWLPMAKAAQEDFKRQQASERAAEAKARERAAASPEGGPGPTPSTGS